MSDALLTAYDSGGTMPRQPPPGYLGPQPDPGGPWEAPPFAILGKCGTAYWFFDASGEIVSLSPRALGQWPDVLSLCGGKQEWLGRHWPAYDRDGVWKGGWEVRGVAAAIMAKCGEMPAFDPSEPRRRYGLWSVPGGTALHLGHQVVWCGQAERAGFSRAGALWPSMAPRPAPAPPCSEAVAQQLEDLLGRWNWEHEHAPAVMLGLVVNGMLGGLAAWRAHGFVIGEAGSGKTTLLRFVAGLCPLTLYRNDFTEAGVRQALAETSASVILDEAEGDDHGDGKLKRVIEMLRRASSGQGVEGVRGSPEQAARSFTVTAAALMGATMAPPLPVQDATRFTLLHLRPLAPGSRPAQDDCDAFLAAHGLALWGRAVASAERIVRLFAVLREALVAEGCSRREGDQLGIIAACYWAMTRDAAFDPHQGDDAMLGEALQPVRWLITPPGEGETDSGGNQALQRLLSMPLDMAGDRLLLGQALSRYRALGRQLLEMSADWPDRATTQGEHEKLDRLLQAHGVRWASLPLQAPAGAPAPPVGLYVAAGSHPRLLRAFDGTPWASQRWAAAIAQLPDSRGGRDAHPVRIGGAKMRGCWVSRATLDRLTRDD
jgi:hypothetical protein